MRPRSAPWPAHAAAARPVEHHGARRGPLVGRRARPLRAPVAGRDPRPGHRAGGGRLPGLGRLPGQGGGGRGDGRRNARPGRRVLRGLPIRTAVRGAPANGSGCRPSRRRWRRWPRDGFDAFYEGDLAERQAAGLAAAGSAITAADLGAHTSTWGEPIATDYRGVRVTTHPPNSSGVVALELLGILGQLEPPSADAFGPDGVTDPAWIHAGIEAAKLAMADRDRHLTDPAFRDVPVERLLDTAYLAGLAARIDPRRAAAPPPATNPRGGGTIYLATVDGAGNAVSLIESNYLGFGSGVVDPATGIHYQNRGSYFSLDPDHPNVLEPRQAHAPHAAPRDAASGTWATAAGIGRGSSSGRWAAMPSRRSMRSSSAPWSMAASTSGRPSRPRAGSSSRPTHFAPPIDVRLEPRHAPAIAPALAALGHHLVPTEPFDGDLGHEHAIELVGGGPAAPDGSLAAATDPRSHGLPAVW